MGNEDVAAINTPRNSLSTFRITKVKELEKSNVDLNERIKELERICLYLKQQNEKLKSFIGARPASLDSNPCNTPTAINNVMFETDEEEVYQETDWIIKKAKKKKPAKKVRTETPVGEKTETELNSNPCNGPNENNNNMIFETDEEEVSKETNWIIQKAKKKKQNKKRRAESSPECHDAENVEQIVHPRPPPKNAEPPGVSNQTNNRNLNAEQSSQLRPPPIMVSNITDFQKFNEQLKNLAKKKFLIKILNKGAYKVSTFDSEDYRNITKSLNSNKQDWHSYENKQIRPIKVMIKKLHHSNSPENIVIDLQSQGYKAIEAVNKLNWKTKEPLDMFRVSFDASEDIKKIYEIQGVLNTIVEVEPVRQQKILPQCKNCQSFGHTKNYCNKQPRCVKCAGKHSTIECTKEIIRPKCCNCGESHPATYRGCVVAKELQKLRNKAIKNRSLLERETHQNQEANCTTRIRNHRANNPSDILQKSKTAPNNIPVRRHEPTTFSSILKSSNNKNTNQDALSLILQRLSKQDDFFKSIDYRLTQLEQLTQQN